MTTWDDQSWRRWVFIWSGLGVLGLFWVTVTSWDEVISQRMYSSIWLDRHADLVNAWYRWPKLASICAALCVIGFALRGRNPFTGVAVQTPTRHYLVVALLTIPILTWLVREGSASACPRDLAAFGGELAQRPFLDFSWQAIGSGRCNPSGHMSSYSWWLALCFLRPPQRRGLGALVLCIVAMFALGSVQILKGAHFMSHLIFSVWWAGVACLILVRVCLLRKDVLNPEW
jgi:membrane-associated PAP2 superfamily phosphatase